MEQKLGKWFNLNQTRLARISVKEQEAARKDLMEYVIRNLCGRTIYGAHSMWILGEDAVTHYTQMAWLKLAEGWWLWKENKTLIWQLCRIASCLMEKQVKKFRRAEARGVIPIILKADNVEVRNTEAEEAEWKADGYRMILEAIKDKPELTAYVEAVRDGGDYEDIAKKLDVEPHEVMLIERRVMYKIKKYRDETF